MGSCRPNVSLTSLSFLAFDKSIDVGINVPGNEGKSLSRAGMQTGGWVTSRDSMVEEHPSTNAFTHDRSSSSTNVKLSSQKRGPWRDNNRSTMGFSPPPIQSVRDPVNTGGLEAWTAVDISLEPFSTQEVTSRSSRSGNEEDEIENPGVRKDGEQDAKGFDDGEESVEWGQERPPVGIVRVAVEREAHDARETFDPVARGCAGRKECNRQGVGITGRRAKRVGEQVPPRLQAIRAREHDVGEKVFSGTRNP